MYKIFIDGRAGTTGLKIDQRLSGREDLEILTIPDALRKDEHARAEAINAADAVFLCLPDPAAREAAALVSNPHTVVIDTSTAHRTAEGWTYGFAELLPGQREKIRASRRIANPGCHATGFLAIATPLIRLGLADASYHFSATSLTGYSGGGKKMIAQYEEEDRPASYDAPRHYGLSLTHKHLPEMTRLAGLSHPPVFNPVVADYFSGMAVSVPVFPSLLKKRVTLQEMRDALAAYYAGEALISVAENPEDGFLSANTLSGSDRLNLYVLGNDDMMTIISVFDNLGKGATGAAVQNMNIALGAEETKSLIL